MAYVHCMPVRVKTMRHGLDNIVSGTFETCDGDIEFSTRKHIVKATNKIYRGNAWKPSAGTLALVDGDLQGAMILVDHIEVDHGAATSDGAANPHLDVIAAMIPRHPPASATLRVWRGANPARIRLVALASRMDRRGLISEELVHGSYDSVSNRWSLWSVTRDGATLSGTGVDAAILPMLARAAGSGLLMGETEKERFERIEAEEIQASKDSRMAPTSKPPSDDCPF